MNKAANSIVAQPRKEFGDNASRRLRHAGYVPAIIYSRGNENVAIALKAEEWQVVYAHGSHLVNIELEGKTIPALVREVQYNYLKNYVVHVDFQQVDLNAEINSVVPIHAVGESYGAAHGGVLEQELHELSVTCRPADLPEILKVDVTALNVGDHMTVAQLTLPEGVKVHNVDLETIIFSVVRPSEDVAAEDEGAAEPEAINETKASARAAEKENKNK